MGAVKGPKLYSFEVRHPEYGTVVVSAVDRAGAIMLAAERWGVKWTKIAAECDVVKLGAAIKPRCRRCGTETAAPGLCLDCQKADQQYRREVAKFRAPRRHPGSPRSREASWGEEEQGSGTYARL